MRNIALQLMYAGTAYHGWQTQKNALSIQEVVEKALNKILGEKVKCTGAGRTDAGVHALVYIANFRTSSSIPTQRLPYALNTCLPDDIVCIKATEVSPSFNAIGSCDRKEYTYVISDSKFPDAFSVNRLWHYPYHRLDTVRMQRAADYFVGTHDFRAVQSVGTHVESTIRTLYWFSVTRTDDLVFIRVAANGFLYNMVRALVGTVVYVSDGKINPPDIRCILAGKNRTNAGPTVPPDGLYMTRLWYHEPGLSLEERRLQFG